MKTIRLETVEPPSGRKPKKLKLDQRMIAKIGNVLYHIDDVKAISIKVMYKNGTTTSFNRSENEDRHEKIEEKIDGMLSDDDE
jgi:hypothetical protein